MIPEGWRELQLKEVIKLASGDSRPRDVTDLPEEHTRHPVYGGNGILGFSSEVNSNADDIIIGRVGEYCGVTRFVSGPKWITDNALYVKAVEASFDRRFLALKMQHYDLSRLRAKGGQPLVSQKPIYALRFTVPSESEQRAITFAIDTWDRAIETVEALTANARAQKQALMQQLLPQGATPPRKRLPGFSGEWREAKLISLAAISKGKQKGRASLADDGPIPVINGGVTPSGYTDHPNTEAGKITISEGGNSCGYVDLITQPFWCGGHCYALKNLKVDRDYLFAVLKHRERRIMSLRVGSGLPNIQKKALSQLIVPVPPKAEQVKIGELATLADVGIVKLETQLAALRREKAALMQQLLTGKRRVKLDDDEVAA